MCSQRKTPTAHHNFPLSGVRSPRWTATSVLKVVHHSNTAQTASLNDVDPGCVAMATPADPPRADRPAGARLAVCAANPTHPTQGAARCPPTATAAAETRAELGALAEACQDRPVQLCAEDDPDKAL